ncbi:chloride intracellular channel Clic-like [Ylistrum balloti]|uniref:chloride intracellular channel Clic-like n=1 Tax=Ylistrum balloti TaxID=509963 RepID=UPI002905B07B|nr:chloride intracellular channel Clic-like [Ylistrum balloti]
MSDSASFFEPKADEDKKKPSFELYIKASTIDANVKGSCPICQQWFMLAYILAEKQCVSFRVYTVCSATPPAPFSARLQSTHPSQYPVVIGLGGEDSNNQSLENRVVETIDDVERFFEEVNPYFPDLKRNTTNNLNALRLFQDLSKKFNLFLVSPDNSGIKFTAYLKTIDEHLRKLETKFLCGSSLSYADCCLLPKLQHVRIAGAALKKYEIPEEFEGIWRYLKNAYAIPAFLETLPGDREVVSHYISKVKNVGGIKPPNLQKLEPPTISVPLIYQDDQQVQVPEEEEEQQVINNGREEDEVEVPEEEPSRENGDDEDAMPEPDEVNREVYEEQQVLENDETPKEICTNGDNLDE